MQKLNLGKKIYLSIFALIVAFVGIFGLFCSQNNNINKVSADEVVPTSTFYGSNLIIPVTLFNSSPSDHPTTDNIYRNIEPVAFKFTLKYNEYDINVAIIELVTNYDTFTLTNVNDWHSSFKFGIEYFISDTKYISGWSKYDPNFNVNAIVGFRLWNETPESSGSNSGFYLNHITYFDINDKWVDIGFYCHVGFELDSPYLFTDRTYYFINNFNNNQYYNTGYNNGYSAGKNEGITEGMQTGYNNGFSAGKNEGFDEGVASANDYSFLGLLGAVVDAPLNMFVHTFDFNILGFNMKDFFLSILTIALIFTIIRLCMGGK